MVRKDFFILFIFFSYNEHNKRVDDETCIDQMATNKENERKKERTRKKRNEMVEFHTNGNCHLAHELTIS